MKEELKQKAKEFTDYLYNAYGSGTGVLFGIPSNCRDGVYALIKLTIERFSEKEVLLEEKIKADDYIDEEMEAKSELTKEYRSD